MTIGGAISAARRGFLSSFANAVLVLAPMAGCAAPAAPTDGHHHSAGALSPERNPTGYLRRRSPSYDDHYPVGCGYTLLARQSSDRYQAAITAAHCLEELASFQPGLAKPDETGRNHRVFGWAQAWFADPAALQMSFAEPNVGALRPLGAGVFGSSELARHPHDIAVLAMPPVDETEHATAHLPTELKLAQAADAPAPVCHANGEVVAPPHESLWLGELGWGAASRGSHDYQVKVKAYYAMPPRYYGYPFYRDRPWTAIDAADGYSGSGLLEVPEGASRVVLHGVHSTGVSTHWDFAAVLASRDFIDAGLRATAFCDAHTTRQACEDESAADGHACVCTWQVERCAPVVNMAAARFRFVTQLQEYCASLPRATCNRPANAARGCGWTVRDTCGMAAAVPVLSFDPATCTSLLVDSRGEACSVPRALCALAGTP